MNGCLGGERPLAKRQEQAGKRAYTSSCNLKRSARSSSKRSAQMCASFGVNELGVDAYPALVALDSAFERVADAEAP